MAIYAFSPDIRYQQKLFLNVALFGMIFLLSALLPAVFIGLHEAGSRGAQIGAVIAVVANMLWIVPAVLAIPPYYRSIRYELHSEEVIVRIGIITKSVKHVPFRTVTNIKMSRGPLDRLLGTGTLDIETAGMSGQGGAEQSLVGLTDVESVYEQVAAVLHRFHGGMAANQAEEDPLRVAGDEAPSAILVELQAIRRAVERA